MDIGVKGFELIKRFEGFRPAVYLCPAGVPTIGYGHVIDREKEPELFVAELTELSASELLYMDVKPYVQCVNQYVTVELTQHQFDALVSLVYNIGMHAFRKSSLLKIINEQRPVEHLRTAWRLWCYAGRKFLPGLLRRRNAELELYEEL